MARQWLVERYLHYIQHNNTTNRYQLASNSNGSTRASILEPTRCIRLAWAQQPSVPTSWLAAPGNGSTSRACTSHTSYDNTTTRPQQLKARREVSTLHTSQQHNQPVPTCWHGQTMARREVSTLHTSQQHNQLVLTCWRIDTILTRRHRPNRQRKLHRTFNCITSTGRSLAHTRPLPSPTQYDAHSQVSSTKHVQLAHSIITHMSSLIHRQMLLQTFINASSSTIHACTNACIVVSLCCDRYRRHTGRRRCMHLCMHVLLMMMYL